MMWKFLKKKVVEAGAVTYDSIILDDFIDQVVGETIDPVIWEEFADKLRDTEQKYLAKLLREINVLQNNYDLVMLIIQELKIHRRIKSVDPNVKLPDLEEIWKVLMSIVAARKTDTPEIIRARSNKLLEQIKMKHAEVKRIQPVAEGSGKVDRSYFSRMISSVSVYHKIQINRKTKLLCEFVDDILIMREQQQDTEAEIKKQKHH